MKIVPVTWTSFYILVLFKFAPTHFPRKLAFSIRDSTTMRRLTSLQSGGGQQSIAFQCKSCFGVFDSTNAYRAHRVHRLAVGTGCADPLSMTELTFQRRGNMATGILRELEPLGENN